MFLALLFTFHSIESICGGYLKYLRKKKRYEYDNKIKIFEHQIDFNVYYWIYIYILPDSFGYSMFEKNI